VQLTIRAFLEKEGGPFHMLYDAIHAFERAIEVTRGDARHESEAGPSPVARASRPRLLAPRLGLRWTSFQGRAKLLACGSGTLPPQRARRPRYNIIPSLKEGPKLSTFVSRTRGADHSLICSRVGLPKRGRLNQPAGAADVSE
jgi:hypothetical protein